jgi:nucleoside-triphosphatase THEP1
MTGKLSEKWIKASIAGTIWAASEIVLGSFLHNLKVPFSGNILTAVGLVILISISYMWTDRGLFWRAGLICALMKTMSPSAVIFGPMIAIFMEGVLLELSVRLLGKTAAGFLIGAMAAMSWNLFQKILNYIIFYGSDIVDVYTNLLKMAQKQLNIKTDIVWLPIIILLVLYSLFGLFAAITGMRVGKRMLRQQKPEIRPVPINTNKNVPPAARHNFNYSIRWLIIDIVLIVFSFILLTKASWIIWSSAIAIIVLIWSVRYKRALRQLAKPGFWIFFVTITLLTAFVFTRIGSGENVLWQGLLTGFQMNFRAVVIILGFATLGTELYNPVIRDFFLKTSFKNLPMALELSVESLPAFISGIPDLRSLVRNPVSIFYHVIEQADRRLAEIRLHRLNLCKVFIITGGAGEGKSTFIKNILHVLNEKQINAGGILSERIMEGNETTGYDIINIPTGERTVFLRQNEDFGFEKIGRFSINPDGLKTGISALRSSSAGSNKHIIVIDEAGRLELQGKGWAQEITGLLGMSDCILIMSVRDVFVDEVKRKWQLTEEVTISISETTYIEAAGAIAEAVSKRLQAYSK